MIYSMPMLVVLSWILGTKDTRSRRARVIALTAGALFALDLVMWHQAILDIGVGLATVLANTQVLWVGLAAWALLRERPSNYALILVPLVLVGVMLMSGLGRADAFGAHPLRGVTWGVGAALAYSSYILTYRSAGSPSGAVIPVLLDTCVGAAAASVLLAWTFGQPIDFTVVFPSHGYLIALAAVVQVGGWMCIGRALPRLAALETSVILLLQPIGAIGWGWLLFHERLSVAQWVGAASVLFAVATLSITGAVRRKPVS